MVVGLIVSFSIGVLVGFTIFAILAMSKEYNFKPSEKKPEDDTE